MSDIKRIYIIEAPDGGGKDTLIANLRANLPSAILDLPLFSTREPGGSAVGEAARAVLKTSAGRGQPMSVSEEFSYMWAGRFALYREVLEWFASLPPGGGTAIFNRSSPSSFAYQAYTRSAPDHIVQSCVAAEQEVLRMVAMADSRIEIRQLYLNVSFDTAKRRMSTRRDGEQDISRFDQLLASVIAGYKRYYDELRQGEHSFSGLIHTVDILDAEQNPLQVLAQAQAAIQSHNVPVLVTA